MLYILKDTFHFANKYNTDLLIGTALGIADIKSLYTNIFHKLGLKSLRCWLENAMIKFHYFSDFQQLTFCIKAVNVIFNFFYKDHISTKLKAEQ